MLPWPLVVAAGWAGFGLGALTYAKVWRGR